MNERESEKKIHSRIFLTFELVNFSFSGDFSSLFFSCVSLSCDDRVRRNFFGSHCDGKEENITENYFKGDGGAFMNGKLFPHVYVSFIHEKSFTARVLSHIFIEEKTSHDI